MDSFEYKDETQQTVDQIYEYCANLMVNEGKSAAEVRTILVNEGMDDANARVLVETLEAQIKEARRSRGQKDMLFGALWCIGGIIATTADIGFIFWGAIVFGAFQFIRGVTYMV